MKRVILIYLLVILSNMANSQNCVMNEEAKRYYNRAITATQIAKTTDDYKKALAEYQKAAELCNSCAELYYRMGLCCEIIGEDDSSYYSTALEYFKKSLAAGNNLSEELKELLQGKIHGMEYAVEQAVAANKDALIPENLCGKWTFHTSNGEANDRYNIIISENQGFYSAEFILYEQYDIGNDRKTPDNPTLVSKRKVDINFDGNIICFSTMYVRSNFYLPQARETLCIKEEFNYELILENGVLKGTRKCLHSFIGSGNGNYSTVLEAVKNGHGRVISDCTGDCGTSNVYFTK